MAPGKKTGKSVKAIQEEKVLSYKFQEIEEKTLSGSEEDTTEGIHVSLLRFVIVVLVLHICMVRAARITFTENPIAGRKF